MHFCVFLSWRLHVWTTIQHHRQAPWLGNGLLGSRDHLWRHHYRILPAAQHPNQDGSRVQEGRLKHHYTSSSAPRGKLDTLSHYKHKWMLWEVEHYFFSLQPILKGAFLYTAFTVTVYVNNEMWQQKQPVKDFVSRGYWCISVRVQHLV